MIHGPKCGYGNSTKNHYRREKYAFVERALGPGPNHVPRPDRVVLLLDEPEGHETFFLINKGYRPQNLFVVNRNPAKVAILQRRVREKTGQSIQALGVELEEACDRICREIDVAHLDFTGCASSKNLRQANKVAALLKPGSVAILNMLKGREKSEYDVRDLNGDPEITAWIPREGGSDFVGTMNLLDAQRLTRMLQSVLADCSIDSDGSLCIDRCRYHSHNMQFGYYQSTSPMIWVATSLTPCLRGDRMMSWPKWMRDAFVRRIGPISDRMEPADIIRVVNGFLNIPPCCWMYWAGVIERAVHIGRTIAAQSDQTTLTRT